MTGDLNKQIYHFSKLKQPSGAEGIDDGDGTLKTTVKYRIQDQ